MAIFGGLAQRLHKDGRNVNQTWRSQNLINSDQSQEIKPKFNQTFVDYPQEPKVYPGERIPTILDDLEEMPPKEPTTLGSSDLRDLLAKSWPRLLQKLSLDDGMKCFLEWKDQYEDCSHYGINNQVVAQFIGLEARYHVLHLLDRQLLNVLMDRIEEENFRDMDHETFVQELLDIFGEASQDDEEFDEEEENDAVREDLNEEFDERGEKRRWGSLCSRSLC